VVGSGVSGEGSAVGGVVGSGVSGLKAGGEAQVIVGQLGGRL